MIRGFCCGSADTESSSHVDVAAKAISGSDVSAEAACDKIARVLRLR